MSDAYNIAKFSSNWMIISLTDWHGSYKGACIRIWTKIDENKYLLWIHHVSIPKVVSLSLLDVFSSFKFETVQGGNLQIINYDFMTLCKGISRYWIKWFEHWDILYVPTVEFASETYEKNQCSMTESLYTSIKVKNTYEISLQWLDPTLYFCIAFFYFKNNRFLMDL